MLDLFRSLFADMIVCLANCESLFIWTLCPPWVNVTSVLVVLFPNSHSPSFSLLLDILVGPDLHLDFFFFFSTDPVLQVPTHVAEYVSLSYFLLGCVRTSFCVAPFYYKSR